MKFVKTLTEIHKNSVREAGGKGASLGEMTRAGIPVPPGFVVLASAFDRFLNETELDAEIEAILKKVNHKDINSVDRASNEIRELIHEVRMPQDLQEQIYDAYNRLFSISRGSTSPQPSPGLGRVAGSRERSKFVAVRSSATAEDSKVASWAGELETYLNVAEKNLISSVMKCWSSLFTPRAVFYAFEKGIYNKKRARFSPPLRGRGKGRGILPVSVAVVIQKMVQSTVSGICFTVHPVTEDRNQMVIEAAFGLGEAIVGGQITPDTYVVHKDDFSILDIAVSEQSFHLKRGSMGGTIRANWRKRKQGAKQKLNGKQIVELAKLCKKIERHYRYPQDIEWAWAKGEFYITQSRPITTL